MKYSHYFCWWWICNNKYRVEPLLFSCHLCNMNQNISTLDPVTLYYNYGNCHSCLLDRLVMCCNNFLQVKQVVSTWKNNHALGVQTQSACKPSGSISVNFFSWQNNMTKRANYMRKIRATSVSHSMHSFLGIKWWL